MDPVVLRLHNAMEKDTIMPTGIRIEDEIGLKETIHQATKAARWSTREAWLEREPAPNLRRGMGVASIWHEIGMGARFEDQSMVTLEMTPDGTLLLSSGSTDMGQSVYSGQGVIAAQVLGVDLDDIKLILPDTDVVPDASTTSATRSTYMVGNAVLNAALKIRHTLFGIASDILETELEDLEVGNHCIWAHSNPDRQLELPALAQQAWQMNMPLRETGVFRMWRPAAPRKADDKPVPHSVFAYGTQIAQVLVDIETGKVSVEKIWAAHDVGKALDRVAIEGQIEGGIVMGIGFALMEELLQEQGRLLNPYLSEYMAPLVTEIPDIEHIIVEVPEPTGPFGAKGIGEPATIPTAPAIANAVADALGMRITQMPMTPDRVLQGLTV
jgi:CO/xanthine dehydrogenase Mo-binding subunit